MTDFRVDLALAGGVGLTVVVGVWSELEYWTSPVAFPAGAYVIGLAASAALVFRRQRPVLTTSVILALVLVYHLAGYPGGAPAFAFFVGLYSIAAYGRNLWSCVVALAFVVVWGVIPALPPTALPWYSFATTGPAIGMIGFIVLGGAAGQVRRSHEQSIADAEAAAESRMRALLAEERLGIARELHDVLAHTVSVISVQSGVALDSFDDRPEKAREAIAQVRALARQAMPELRRTLELLRSNTESSESPYAINLPQPGLRQLGYLFTEAEAAGLAVHTQLVFPNAALSPFVELTAYRIVQEALTNVIRHSHATTVDVTVRAEGEQLAVSVADNGCGASAIEGGPSGLGLLGMRERTQAAGGTLATGDRPAGGFLVEATLPIGSP